MSLSGGGRIAFDVHDLLSAHDPVIRRFIGRHLSKTYPEFLDHLYDDLLEAIGRLEANPQAHIDQSEDGITLAIVDMLSMLRYESVEHDAVRGGHTDLCVRHLEFEWIAEAKIFSDVSALRAGFEQLATRYSSPVVRGEGLHAGLLAYLKRPDAAAQVLRWREHVQTLTDPKIQQTRDCSRRGPLAFYSEHQDVRFGLPFEVWHLCVSLFHQPRDASARRRAPLRA